MKNKLYFTDNLDILREMDSDTVDLICTNPPFNTDRNYNIASDEADANDSLDRDNSVEDIRANIKIKADNCKTYAALYDWLHGYDLALSNSSSAMRSYLEFLGIRLVEMHRILSNTGSIYLHCDPTVSHYLKCMMDAIFGIENYRNEIVWQYRGLAPASSQFHKMHDIILFYTKSDKYVFTKTKPVYENEILDEDVLRNFSTVKLIRSKDGKRNYRRRDDAMMYDVWDDISHLLNSIERLGYPTQKPRRLYERMIQASSNEGELVLDPFCGSGTTLDAAQAHNRNWLGIDISILALNPIKYRLQDRYGLEPSKDYEIEGYPTNIDDVKELASDETKHDEFSHWATTLLGLTPVKHIQNDDQPTIWRLRDKKRSDVRIIAEVKAGKPTQNQFRTLRKSIDDNIADIGILISLDSVTPEMREIAEKMDKFEYKGLKFPRLQFWQITDAYFEDPETIYDELQLPGKLRVKQTKGTERYLPEIKMTGFIDGK